MGNTNEISKPLKTLGITPADKIEGYGKPITDTERVKAILNLAVQLAVSESRFTPDTQSKTLDTASH